MQQPRKKSKAWLIIGLAVVVAIFAFIAANAFSSHSNASNTGAVVAHTNIQSQQSVSKATTNHFVVGQTVKAGDTWGVTVDKVSTSQGAAYDTPKSGNQFVLIDVTLKNVSSTEQHVSSALMFTLSDATGQQYTETFVTNANTTPDGKVEAGSLLRGTLAYEVPKAQHNFTFAFDADLLSQGQTIWDIQA